MKLKRYIVRKYIMASSASTALKKERRIRPDDVYIDDAWAKNNDTQLVSAVGFTAEPYDEQSHDE